MKWVSFVNSIYSVIDSIPSELIYEERSVGVDFNGAGYAETGEKD